MAQMKDVKPTNNIGEATVWEAFKNNLPSDVICYCNRTVFGREFDSLLLIPDRCVFVVEIKGWLADHVHVDEQRRIFLNNSTESTRNPYNQVNNYRHYLKEKLTAKFNIKPMVYGLVCYPFISKDQYYQNGLCTITEEDFTLFKEDLESAEILFNKLNKVYLTLFNSLWTKMDDQTMSHIRSLFEFDFSMTAKPPLEKKPYSSLICTKAIAKELISTTILEYKLGAKKTLITSDQNGIEKLLDELNNELNKLAIKVSGGDLKYQINPNNKLVFNGSQFSIFNFSIYLVSSDVLPDETLEFIDGVLNEGNKELLAKIQNHSSFNFEQYLVEHAPLKDLAVKAGAGTGKTYSMISRISYLYHKDITNIDTLSKGIVMLTFTNEAATNMKKRIRAHFMNYYILTNNSDYIDALADIELMQISTIHKFANKIIKDSSISLGLGYQFSIVNSDYRKAQIYSKHLSKFIQEKQKEIPSFSRSLPDKTYKLVKLLMEISARMYNKGIDVKKIEMDQLGESISIIPSFNEMIVNVIKEAELEINIDNISRNSMSLDQTMIYFLDAINSPSFKKNKYPIKYMFIDEFQDTDDTQIDIFIALKKAIGFKFFVVGDLKQSIYRFRGATLSAFARLKSGSDYNEWQHDYDLRINYRTDTRLLNRFDQVFSKIGTKNHSSESVLLPYDEQSVLVSSLKNPYVNDDEIFESIEFNASKPEYQYDKLFGLIDSYKTKLESIQKLRKLSINDRTIAILVRTNSEVESVVREGLKRNIKVETKSGGDLYESAPAIDLCILLSALYYPNDPKYLFTLIDSRNVNTDFDLFSISDCTEEEKTNAMITCLDQYYAATLGMKWYELIQKVHEKPILMVLKEIYEKTKPWLNGLKDAQECIDYQNNYDLLIELVVRRYSVESLTLEVMHQFILQNVITGFEQQSRKSEEIGEAVRILCITVHKSKGLEFANVIMPFTTRKMEGSNSKSTDVMLINNKIGYRVCIGDQIDMNSNYEEEEEMLQAKKEEARILYVAMTRAINKFAWLEPSASISYLCWNNILKQGGE